MAGIFVALEGIDGSGKSTIAERLLYAIRQRGLDVILTREPGGTAIGEHIRSVLFGADSIAMLPQTETLLFAAARAQLVGEVIQPELARGKIVITDRFTDSSLAYQWGGRQLNRDVVTAAQHIATGGLVPDLKILLDLPVEVALRRRLAVRDDANRLDRETHQFHARVRDAYHSLVAADPERWRVIDAEGTQDRVWCEVWAAVIAFGLTRETTRHVDSESTKRGYP